MMYVHGESPLGAAEKKSLISGAPFDIVCITGFAVMADGNVRVAVNREKLAHISRSSRARGARMYPLIAPRSVSQGKRLLRSVEARDTAIRNLGRILKVFNFTGLHLDFEYFPPDYRHDLAVFIRELKSSFPGTTISMAVFPQTGFPSEYARFHDLALLAPLLDEIVLMCYDLHRPGTAPGPVTSVDWARRSIAHARAHVDSRRLYLGIPAYGYRWTKDGRAAVVTGFQGKRLIHSALSVRDPSGTVRLNGRKDGSFVFFADDHTRAVLTALAKEHRLAGIAVWRLGFDDL